ncbi:hypothetical protein ACVWZ4_003363 [Bradyrhizobium sp. USDA 4472]
MNDLSLQGQFNALQDFEIAMREILSARIQIAQLRLNLFSARTLGSRSVFPTLTFREAIQRSRDADFRRAVLGWIDRNGPFVDDDRLPEQDDYFEYNGIDITDSGLGEAARRVKAMESVATFSFPAGAIPFDVTPLYVDHGLHEDRIGRHAVENLWLIDQLRAAAHGASIAPTSWKALVEYARERFPRLRLPNNIYEDERLAREPFDAVIRDRVISLLGYLDLYMSDRQPNGAEGIIAQQIVRDHFVGDRALFSGESPTNQRQFLRELTFDDPDNSGQTVFAHWHGKISHRYFRLHFEWPVPAEASVLKVVYFGPKITKS